MSKLRELLGEEKYQELLETLSNFHTSYEEVYFKLYSGIEKVSLKNFLDSWKQAFNGYLKLLPKLFKVGTGLEDILVIKLLYDVLEEFYLQDISDQLLEAFTEKRYPWRDSERVSLMKLIHLRRASDDPSERQEADQLLRKAYKDIWELKLSEWHARFRFAGYITGYEQDSAPSPKAYLNLLTRLKNVNYTALLNGLRDLRSKLSDVFHKVLRDVYELSEVPAPKHEFTYLSLVKEDIGFSGDLHLLTKAILGERGIPKPLTIDLEDREFKNPRAACFPIKPGEDVRISIRLTGGLDDLIAYFHELGHALHYSYFDPSKPWIDSRSLNGSLTESFAFLIEYLFLDPRTIRSLVEEGVLRVSESALLKAWGYQLFLIIRYISKLEFELSWYLSNSDQPPDRFYSDLLTRYTGVIYYPEEAIYDIDPGVYSADYLRAWLGERILRNKYLPENEKGGEKLLEVLIPHWKRGKLLDISDLLGSEEVLIEEGTRLIYDNFYKMFLDSLS